MLRCIGRASGWQCHADAGTRSGSRGDAERPSKGSDTFAYRGEADVTVEQRLPKSPLGDAGSVVGYHQRGGLAGTGQVEPNLARTSVPGRVSEQLAPQGEQHMAVRVAGVGLGLDRDGQPRPT